MQYTEEEQRLVDRFNKAETIHTRIMIKRVAFKAGYIKLVDLMLTSLMPGSIIV